MALFAMCYNFVCIHKTLRTSPAMAEKVTERLWEIGDIVDVLEAWEAANLLGVTGEKYVGDYSRRICGDWCFRLLVRCHEFME